jgi:hypothetical protein
MLGAGMDYIGVPTESQLVFDLDDNDERIFRVKGLLAPPKKHSRQ